jgi:hypothetical protein
MVLRMWKTRSTAKQAVAYIELATKEVFPKVRAIEGHRGGVPASPRNEDGVELVVLTLWDSMEAVRRFAGPEPNKAVVEPEARAVLTSFNEYVTHFEIVHGGQWRGAQAQGDAYA